MEKGAKCSTQDIDVAEEDRKTPNYFIVIFFAFLYYFCKSASDQRREFKLSQAS